MPETTAEHAFATRIGSLPDATRRLLALAAAEDLGELAVLDRAAAHLGLELQDLAAAERAGLVTVDVDRLGFCHPLARSAAYRATHSDERRAAHKALASADPDPDRQAWHAAPGRARPGRRDRAGARQRRPPRPHPRRLHGRRQLLRARCPPLAAAGRARRAPPRRRRGRLAGGPHRPRPAAARGGARAVRRPRARPPPRPRGAARGSRHGRPRDPARRGRARLPRHRGRDAGRGRRGLSVGARARPDARTPPSARGTR